MSEFNYTTISEFSYTMVIPSVVPEMTQRCVDSFFDPQNILVVDNTVNNRGVASSWNVGVDRVLSEDQDALIVCSSSVVFGEKGGRDFIGELAQAHVAGERGLEADNGLGWHLIAFDNFVLSDIGYFDEIFYPAYFEDNDYSYRIQRGYGMTEKDYPIFRKVDVDCELVGIAEGIKRTDISINFVGLEEEYAKKWGGVSPNETYQTPYNDPLLDHRYAQRIFRGTD